VCGKPAVIEKTGYAQTQDEIQTFIEAERSAGRVSDVSVYFRDLENGPIFGIDENADFTPASLLKLPLALFYVVTAENNSELLKQKLSFSESQETFTQSFAPSEEIKVNQPYTIEELLMHMLANSDNKAYELLQTHLDASGWSQLVKETYLEMGLITSSDRYTADLTVRRYASLFRGLYNASYVGPELSDKVLGWLAQSKFTLGLAGGVPEGVKIAHKFGERSFPNGTKQLHDCGIIYYPDNPYLLCIMTRGNNYDELASVIRTISKDVYEEVNSRRIN
jgi:beta-lactamase class A